MELSDGTSSTTKNDVHARPLQDPGWELPNETFRNTCNGRIPVPHTIEEAIERAKKLLREAEGKLTRYYWFLWDLEKSNLWQPADSFEQWVRSVGLKIGNYVRYRSRLTALGEEIREYPPATVAELDKQPPHIQRRVREKVDEEAAERGVTPSPSLVRKHAAKVLREEPKQDPTPTPPDAAACKHNESPQPHVRPRNGVSGRSCRELMRNLYTQLPLSLRPLGTQLSRAISSQWQNLKQARRERDEARAEVARLRERLSALEKTAGSRKSCNLSESFANSEVGSSVSNVSPPL